MGNQIRGMTTGQTRRARDTVLRLTVEWVKLRDCARARICTLGAIADLAHDCYIARTRVAFSVRDGEVCFGKLTWRLDPAFAPLAAPEAELRVWRRRRAASQDV